MSDRRIMMGAESLLPGNGGICRVARLVTRVLAEELRAGRLQAVDAVALSDKQAVADLGITPVALGGSRLRFLRDMHLAALRHSHYIYDFVGMARAHPRLAGLRRPMMVYLHGIEIWENTRPDRVMAARRADALVVNSAFTLQRAQAVHGKFPAEAKVCWLATEEDEPPASAPEPHGPPTVMILARIDEDGGYKGHRELVAAWPRVVSAVPDARLVIVGRGPGFDMMKQLAAASPAANQIDLKGFVPDPELEPLWRQATVFAMPSRSEGFGLVYIEAMRHAVPVIASIHDAAPEVNLDGQTGYNVDMDRPDQLPERLIHLLRDRDAASSMGRRGQQRWHDHFRYSAFRDRFRTHLGDFLQ